VTEYVSAARDRAGGTRGVRTGASRRPRPRSLRAPPAARGYRHGSEDGTLKTAEGVLRVQVPQGRGLADTYRSQSWTNLAKTSAPLTSLIVERVVGGRSQRDLAAALETARGPFVLSTSRVSALTEPLSQA
jgi:transposase-like protein